MNPIVQAVFILATIIVSTSAHCYDAQVTKDQFFDESFVCNDKLPYPTDLIRSDLEHTMDMELLYFLDTSSRCANETKYISNSYASVGDYAYQCVCPTQRRRIEAVYMKNDVCFVVDPERQDIQYAKCSGHCNFDYGTKIATASRGYFCVHQSFVQREFVVWCPHTPINLASGSRVVLRKKRTPLGSNAYQLYGSFHRVTYTLPTLCSCRGYFCDNHFAK